MTQEKVIRPVKQFAGLTSLRKRWTDCPEEGIRVGLLKMLEKGHHGLRSPDITSAAKMAFCLETAEELTTEAERLDLPEVALLMKTSLEIALSQYSLGTYDDKYVPGGHLYNMRQRLLKVLAIPQVQSWRINRAPLQEKITEFLSWNWDTDDLPEEWYNAVFYRGDWVMMANAVHERTILFLGRKFVEQFGEYGVLPNLKAAITISESCYEKEKNPWPKWGDVMEKISLKLGLVAEPSTLIPIPLAFCTWPQR